MQQSINAYATSERLFYDITGHANFTEEQRMDAYRAWKCKVATYAAGEGCDLVDMHGNRLSTSEACDLINVGILVEVVS